MKTNKLFLILGLYHLLFIFFSYQYIVISGGDANLYWFKNNYTSNKEWFSFFKYGTDFILFLNYPLAKIGLPFFGGFFIYGTIGFLGILKWMQWSDLVFGKKIYFKGINLLGFIFFLPNLHFWTATLGKEPLMFYGIASIFYGIASKKYNTFGFVLGSLLLLMIRPHVAFMLLLAMVVVFLFQKKNSIKKRIIFGLISVASLSTFTYMALQLSNIKYLNWERIRYFNDYSILSIRKSGSYVPMLEYNYFSKLFSFYFRPLFFDCHSYLMVFASIENVVVLMLHVFALFFAIYFFKKIDFPQWLKIILWFTLIAGLIYVQRYANLGIFMRTKIMFQPFLLIGLLYIVKQGFELIKYKLTWKNLN